MRENMKKVLLATSILAASTGFAAAEVAVSGSARMGVVYNSTLDSGSGAAFFSSRVRIVFTASGETDGGLAFGASVRADQQGGNNNDAGADQDGDSNGDSTVFISGAFGKLTMGDVGGAADALVGQVSGVGYGPIDDLQEIGFVGTDKTAAYYEYSTGGFTIGLGIGQVWQPDPALPAGGTETRNTANIAVKYAMGDYTFAIGYETADDLAATALVNEGVDQLSASASAKFGAVTLKARVSSIDAVVDTTPFAVSVDYVIGATTLTGFYTDFDNDVQHVGLGAAYDLGGGATLAGGIVQQMNPAGVDDETFADMGVKFSF
jgi:outer membrane protein OmpU